MSSKKVVITGGPSTGKTVVINELEKRGYTCLHEVIRSMTSEHKNLEKDVEFKSNPIVSVSDPIAFNTNILNARLEQFNTVSDSKDDIIFYDRGLPDVLAYMDCFKQEYDESFRETCKSNRYDFVFLMPPWKDIYVSDGERFESFEESLQIHDCLFDAYTRFGYEVVIVPKDSIAKRIDFILARLNATP